MITYLNNMVFLLFFFSLSSFGFLNCNEIFNRSIASSKQIESENLLVLPSGAKINPVNYSLDKSDPDYQRISNQLEKIKNNLKEEWGSENPDDWQEVSGVETVAFIESINKQKSLISDKSPLSMLDLVELYSIGIYTTWNYQFVNKYLWQSENVDILAESMIKLMISSLNKLPIFKSNEHKNIVYRSEVSTASFSGSDNEKLKIVQNKFKNLQDEFISKGFLSTTKGLGLESRNAYVDNELLLFVIHSKTGRDISQLSHGREYEEEVLFLPNTKFKILKKEIVQRKKTQDYPYELQYIVYLEEI